MANTYDFERYYDERGEIDATLVALPTAIKTLFVVFVSGVLILVLFMGMLPLSSMSFFESVGLNDRALDMATLAANREQKRDTSANSKYADALYYKMVLSEELYLNGGRRSAQKYLKDIKDSTYNYSSIDGIEERNARIDHNNLKKIAPLAHASLFSFSDRVSNLNYFASIRLGKSDEFLICGNSHTLDDLLLGLDQMDEDDLYDDFSSNDKTPEMALFYCIFFGQLTEYIKYKVETGDSFSMLSSDQYRVFTTLEQKLGYFRDFALYYMDNFDSFEYDSEILARQTQLYLTRSVARLYDGLFDASRRLEQNYATWDSHRKTHGVTMMEYFVGNMLTAYIEFYNQTVKTTNTENT